MYLEKDTFLVVGISKSGVAATNFLLSRGVKCYIVDEITSDGVLASINMLEQKGAVTVSADHIEEIIQEVDIVVISPGVPIDNKIPVCAKKYGKRIIGELELGYIFSNCPIIAVTGTNGKTTTCSLIADILTRAKIKNYLVGNIGIPYTSKINDMGYNTVAVTEVSSFQLESMSSFTPHVAVVTNISEDHLSRHYNMQNYIYLKSKILYNLRESEYAVLNYDDYVTRNFAEKTKGKIIYFSTKEKIDGVYIEDGIIYYKGLPVMEKNLINIKGEHNLYNILAAVAVCKAIKIPDSDIAEGIIEFKGIKHRIEFIKNVNGIDFYNDSKATNVDSTLKALNSMEKNTVLILGGKDKGQSYDELFSECKKRNVVKTVLYGETRYKMIKSAERAEYKNFCVATNLFSAVKLAYNEAKEGECVLLSPACSSFDEFSGFEERGEKFCQIVGGLE